MKNITNTLTKESIDQVKRIYKMNGDPFLIGFSGGKDSTLTLDIIMRSLQELYDEDNQALTKNTYVVTSDTLIENPFVLKRIEEVEKFIKSGKIRHLKFEFIKCQPNVNETFWTLIIGRGYPLPLNRFRWCTRHLKIKPMELASYEIQNKYKNIVNVLGIRKNESPARRKKMSDSIIENESYLFKNFEDDRNVIFAPIQNFEIDNLWDYLLTNEKSFWGSDFKILFQMYQDSSKDCPTSNEMRITASKADSCGNSRWGCWICPLSNIIWVDNMFENGILDFKEVAEFRKKLLFERDILENRYIGKHIRKMDGTYSLGIRGLQKLKYDAHLDTFYWAQKNNSRPRQDIVIKGKLAKDWKLELNYNDIDYELLYDDKSGANNKLVVKKNDEYFIFVPGPYTLKYRLELLEKTIKLKFLMKNKIIRAGTEEAQIDIISNEEYYMIKKLMISNAEAISIKKHKYVLKELERIDRLWDENIKNS